MLLLALFDPASACCSVDTDRDERRATAPLVALGTVVDIQTTEDRWEILQRVRIDREIRGHVVSGELLLRSVVPTWSPCGGSLIFGVGEQIHVIGRPDATGTLVVSPCTDDIGRPTDVAWVEALGPGIPGWETPGADKETGEDLPGLLAWHGAAEARVRVAGTPLEGTLLWADEREADAIFEMGGLDVVDRVARDRLERVLVEPVTAGGDLVWRPGVAVKPDGTVRIDEPTLKARLRVPPGTVGDRWIEVPPPPRRTEYARAEMLTARTATGLHGSPEGPPVADLLPSADGQYPGYMLTPDGPAVDGWLPVYLDSASLAGRGWVRAGDVTLTTPWGTLQGLVGGNDVVGIGLYDGVEVRDPVTGMVFARAEAKWVDWLTTSGDRAWVVIETPTDRRVGEISCDPGDGRTRCTPR